MRRHFDSGTAIYFSQKHRQNSRILFCQNMERKLAKTAALGANLGLFFIGQNILKAQK
jgi:hypothetical protein